MASYNLKEGLRRVFPISVTEVVRRFEWLNSGKIWLTFLKAF
jgi:hypothetical protein